MSDAFGTNPFGSSAATDPFGFGAPDPLKPYVAQQQQQAQQKFSLLTPVKFIFDLLSRGQYLTANVAESVIKSVRTGEPLGQSAVDALSAAFAGITGQQKGDWQNILFGGKDVYSDPEKQAKAQTFEGLFPNANLPSWAKKVIGFAADVALDPTTYITFGATGAARAAAKSAAEEATMFAIKELGNSEKLAGALRTGIRDVANEGFDKAAKYIAGKSPDLSKYLNDVYKETFSKALRMPAGDIQKMMLARGEEVGKLGPTVAEEIAPIMQRIQGGYTNLGAGTVATKLGPFGIGQELFQKPATSSPAIQLWDSISNMFKNSPVGTKLSDAWWAVNSKGPLKGIRDMFGIQTGNPLAQTVHNLALSGADRVTTWTRQAMTDAYQIGQGLTPEIQNSLKDAFGVAESVKKFHPEEAGIFGSVENIINDPQATMNLINTDVKIPDMERNRLNAMLQNLSTVGDKQALVNAATSIDSYTQSLRETTQEAVARGILPKEHYVEEYLPRRYEFTNQYRGTPSSPGGTGANFNQTRKFTQAEAESQDIYWFKTLFGVDDATASRMIRDKGLGSIGGDLPTLLAYRAQAEAKLRSRIALSDDLRNFGVPYDEANQFEKLSGERVIGDANPDEIKQIRQAFAFKQSMERNAGQLVPVPGKEYEGLLFPKDVADVINRVKTATDDPGMKGFMRLWGGFTSWWRGFSTLSGGFNIRNFIQDNMTDFLHHGTGAFNPATYKDALVATIYAMAKDNPKPLLENFAMSIMDYNKTLSKRYGDLTVQEIADYGLREGLISQFSRSFDPAKIGQQGMNAKPWSPQFAPVALNRKVEQVLSSTDRMKFFFNDFSKNTKLTPKEIVDGLSEYTPSTTIGEYEKFINSGRFQKYRADLNYSMLETKKWLFDYADLSLFEKNRMKNIFPFYTWLRKNIPAQLATIVTNPSIYSMIPKGEEALSTGVNIPPEAIPDWLRQQGSVPIGTDAKGNPTFWTPNLGYSDINKIPLMFTSGGMPKMDLQNLKDEIMSIAHPMIKDAVQLIPDKGWDVFYKRDLNYKAPAPYLMQYFLQVPGMMQFTDGLLRVAGIQKGLGAVKDDQGQIRIDAKIAKVLEDELPILRTIERTMGAGLSAIPGLDQAIGHLQQSDPVKMTTQFFKLLSFYGGLKFNTYDVEQEKQRFASGILSAAQSEKSAAGKYTPMAKVRSAQYQTALQRRMAKYGL